MVPKTTQRRCVRRTFLREPLLFHHPRIPPKDGDWSCDTWRGARPFPVEAETQQSGSQHRTARGAGEANPKDPSLRMKEILWGGTWQQPFYVQPQETSRDPDVGIAGIGAGRGKSRPGARIACPSGPPNLWALRYDLSRPMSAQESSPSHFCLRYAYLLPRFPTQMQSPVYHQGV